MVIKWITFPEQPNFPFSVTWRVYRLKSLKNDSVKKWQRDSQPEPNSLSEMGYNVFLCSSSFKTWWISDILNYYCNHHKITWSRVVCETEYSRIPRASFWASSFSKSLLNWQDELGTSYSSVQAFAFWNTKFLSEHDSITICHLHAPS